MILLYFYSVVSIVHGILFAIHRGGEKDDSHATKKQHFMSREHMLSRTSRYRQRTTRTVRLLVRSPGSAAQRSRRLCLLLPLKRWHTSTYRGTMSTGRSLVRGIRDSVDGRVCHPHANIFRLLFQQRLSWHVTPLTTLCCRKEPDKIFEYTEYVAEWRGLFLENPGGSSLSPRVLNWHHVWYQRSPQRRLL